MANGDIDVDVPESVSAEADIADFEAPDAGDVDADVDAGDGGGTTDAGDRAAASPGTGFGGVGSRAGSDADGQAGGDTSTGQNLGPGFGDGGDAPDTGGTGDGGPMMGEPPGNELDDGGGGGGGGDGGGDAGGSGGGGGDIPPGGGIGGRPDPGGGDGPSPPGDGGGPSGGGGDIPPGGGIGGRPDPGPGVGDAPDGPPGDGGGDIPPGGGVGGRPDPTGPPPAEPPPDQPDQPDQPDDPVDFEQIERDVGEAIQSGELEGSEVTESERNRAIAEAMRETEGPAEPFRPDAPGEGTQVRGIGDDVFAVDLATPTGTETVVITAAGPGGEFVAPFQASEAEQIRDVPAMDRAVGFEQSRQREQFRAQAAEEISRQVPGTVSPGDVQLQEQDGTLEATLTEEAVADVQDRASELREGLGRQQDVDPELAASLERQLEVGVGVQQTGGPGPGGVQVDVEDLDRGEDFILRTAGGGVAAELTPDFLAEQFREDLAEQTGVQTGGLRLGEEIQVQEQSVSPETAGVLRAAAGLFEPAAPGLASALEGTAEGGRAVSLTPEGREAITRSQIAAEQPGRDVSALRFDEEGRIRAETRQESLEDAPIVEQLSQFALGPPGSADTTPLVPFGEQEIGAAGSRAFEAVAGPPGPEERAAVDAAVPDVVQETAGVAGEGISAGVQELEEFGPHQAVIGPRGDIEESVLETSEGAAQFLQPGVEATAEVTGDVAEVFARSTPVGFALAGPEGFEESLRDVGRGPEAEAQGGVVETTTTGLTAGFGESGVLAARGPQFIQSVGETAFESGASALSQNPAESAVAAGAFTTQTAGEVATQVARNPLRTGGLLLATGGIFGGARALGPRASLATRGALQPGEELLGRGGAGTFRGASGAAERAGLSRTAGALGRTGRTLFPRGEPLFASEEAAIAVAGRARDVAGRGARRAADVGRRTSVSMRPGAGLGGLRIEVGEGETDVDPAIAEELSRFERASRVRSAEARAEQQFLESQMEESSRLVSQSGAREVPDRQEDIFVSEPGGRERPEPPSPPPRARRIGQGPAAVQTRAFRTDVETEAAEGRVEEAQQSEVLAGETELERRLEGAPAVEVTGAQELVGQAQRSEVLAGETELERGGASRQVFRAESAVRPALRSDLPGAGESLLAGVDARGETMVGTESMVGTDAELRTELRQEQEQRGELDLELETEFESEFETELESEFETELERELEREQEQEQERESEFETELESERELETELFRPREDDDDRSEEFGLFAEQGRFEVDPPSLAEAGLGIESAEAITEGFLGDDDSGGRFRVF